MHVRQSAPSLLTALLSAVVIAATALTTAVVAAPAAAAGASAEAAFVERINNARARHGLAPLRVRPGLTDYARRHAAAMAARRSLFHTSTFSVLCCWSSIAENVGFGDSVRGVHLALLSSPGHRANILDSSKRGVGVGVVRAGGRLWVTQVFREPR